MEDHRGKGASRRNNDRRGEHRRHEHRRKENIPPENERRVVVDQRSGYQRKSNRRSGRDRRVAIMKFVYILSPISQQ